MCSTAHGADKLIRESDGPLLSQRIVFAQGKTIERANQQCRRGQDLERGCKDRLTAGGLGASSGTLENAGRTLVDRSQSEQPIIVRGREGRAGIAGADIQRTIRPGDDIADAAVLPVQ